MSNETKFTPGPWNFDRAPESYYIRSERYGGIIATVERGCAVPNGDPYANARLIAAAPDLLEVASETMDLAAYLNDFATLSGGEMAEKYGEDPSDGFANIISRMKRMQRIGLAAISKATLPSTGK